MINVANEARKELNSLLVAEINKYPDRYPAMLDAYTFAIVLSETQSESSNWELSASAISNTMPKNSFVISSGVQFHHPLVQNLDARIEWINGKFIINGQNVRLLAGKKS